MSSTSSKYCLGLALEDDCDPNAAGLEVAILMMIAKAALTEASGD